MTNLVFNPIHLVNHTKTVIGFDMVYDKISDKLSIYQMAQEVAEEWTEDCSEDDEFGSSDMTFAIKDFIERLIIMIGGNYKTDFTPRLTVINN